MTQSIESLKKDKKLNSEALSLSKQLSADNLQRTIAYVSLVILVIIAFFVSLADAKFNWLKVLEAQFWIDFSITVGGGLFLKWVFGRYGNYEGHRNKGVVKALLQIEKDNKDIEKNSLLSLFKSYILFNNWTRKTKAIRNKVYNKLDKRPNKKKWLNLKTCVKYEEELLKINRETNIVEYEETKEKLEDLNFDLDAYKIKYPMIKEDTLRTGFASASATDEEVLTYSEMWQLFGKSSIVTVLTTLMSILLAVSSVMMEDITMATMFIFFTRVGIYLVNAYVGFIISKTAVERVKLNVLQNIHSFLRTFLEANNIVVGGE